MERRLATILVADVVGYSRLMGADEVGTLRHFNVLRQDFIEPLIGQHRGRVVKLMGDGLLVEFSSVVAAVECAMAWQEGVAARAGEVPPDKQIRFRIGINLGDVIVENDDLFGDGVNVAARLEAMALPGGICLSDDAQRQARGKVDAIFEDLGAKELKNIAEPLRVFRVVMEGAADIASDDTAAPAPVGQPTLAAVPFRHLGDPAQSYITEGLTETLGTALSLFEEFDFVGAPTVNGPHQPSFLLDGSVQILGSRVRISVQLSETASGRKVWGKTLDHTTEDVFAMQDEVVGIVASTMGEAIWEEGARALAAKPQDRYTPYDWTLDGIQHLHRNDPSENHAARDSLEKALAMAPELPVALIGVGWTYTTELVNGWPTDRTDAYDYCVDIAKDLLTRNERYDQAHRLLARLYHFAGQHDEALKHSKRAYDINPYNSDLIVSYGLSLVYTGAAAEGVGYIERGCRINPYAPAYYQAYLALGYFLSGRYDEAVARLRGLERPIGSSRLFLAASLAALGRLDEARGELSAHRAEHPEVSLEVIAGSIPLKEESDRAAYLGALAKAGLPGRAAAELVETTVFEPPDTPSIAVLPFDNMSGDKKQDYFADGITEDIITEISKVSGLMVISRNSTFTYKGKAAKVQDVCRDLGVRYILEGSVRKAGERVRITAQLIDGRSGGHLWAERYDCKLEDIFAVQDDVTDKIVRALEVKLVGARGRMRHARRPTSPRPMIAFSAGASSTDCSQRTATSRRANSLNRQSRSTRTMPRPMPAWPRPSCRTGSWGRNRRSTALLNWRNRPRRATRHCRSCKRR